MRLLVIFAVGLTLSACVGREAVHQRSLAAPHPHVPPTDFEPGSRTAVRLLQTMPGHEGKGYASALLEHAVGHAREQGLHQLISDPEGGTTERAGRPSQKLSAEQTPQEGAKEGKVWKVDLPLTGIDKRIADYKPDRSLEDPAKTADFDQYLKNARYVPYSKTPFFKEVNELQGTPDPDKVDVADYIHARASLFNNQDVEDVPLDKVVVTQPKVNKDRVQEIIDKPETDEVTPILAVRYKGETYILNGHHRVAANIKQGRRTITAHVLNLTENKQPILPKDSMQVTAAKEAATRVDHPDWTATDLGRTHETPEKTEITPPKNCTSVKPPTGRDDLQRYVSDIEKTPEYQKAYYSALHLAPANATQEQTEAITLKAHKDANGELTKDRAILHEQIVNQMLCGKATVPQGKRPVFVMMLGKSGSGKTTHGKAIARRIAYETNGNSYLTTNDPDEARSYLPEYNGYNAAATQAESKMITDDMLMPRAMRMHQNILLDQTGSNAEKMKRYADVMTRAGYDVHAILIHKPIEQSVRSVFERFQREGRFVSADYLCRYVDDKPEATYEGLKAEPNIRSLTYIDNTDNRGILKEAIKK